ncbi:MAG: DUF4132 domain-containing protein [Planctomycetota bacterium]
MDTRLRSVQGQDGFPRPAGPDGELHARIDAVLAAHAATLASLPSYSSRPLKEVPAWDAIARADGAVRRAYALALAQRVAWIRAQPPEFWGFGETWSGSRHPRREARYAVEAALAALLRSTLPFAPAEFAALIELAEAQDWGDVGGIAAWKLVLRQLEGRGDDVALPEHVCSGLRRAITTLADKGSREALAIAERLRAVLGEGERIALVSGEPWADRVLAELAAVSDAEREAWGALLLHARTATMPKPTAAWSKRARTCVAGLPAAASGRLVRWFDAVAQPNAGASTSDAADEAARWRLHPSSEDLLKGLAWSCSEIEDATLARALGRLALTCLRKFVGLGPRAPRVANACVWALGAMPGTTGIAELAILTVRGKSRSALKEIEKALAAAAKRLGMTREEVEELGIPTYGLTEVGVRRERLGDTTAELRVTGTTSTELRWLRPDGRPQKSPPAAVRATHADAVAALKDAAKDLERMLPAQRDRIERSYLRRASWPVATWRERYLDHPLVGVLARRLIWRLVGPETEGVRAAAWLDGVLVDADDRPLPPPPDGTRVELWHPLTAGPREAAAWRAWLATHRITQPFKQAHREIYPLTPAEVTTRVYSNRFAAHVVRQHQFHALCDARGWRDQLRLMVDDTVDATSVTLPAFGLRAEFWVEGCGDEYGVDTNETGTYLRLATDQVRFYRADVPPSSAHVGGGGFETHGEPLPLADVPPLAFSEVMRDVDLFVGVASVGNDPTWSDGGPGGRAISAWNHFAFGELSATAVTRREVLEALVPRLALRDRCTFTDRYLVVRGDLRTYKIHLGSGNIRMEPDDAYLCIVPARGADADPQDVYLPFEGDRTLALILSKALLLAADTEIRDETILAQLQRS